MKKYLIIGALGTLGTEFRKNLPENETILTDSNTLDITNSMEVENFLNQYSPEIVINCAGYTNVDGAEENYKLAEKINGTALTNLSKTCNKISAKLIHFSSGMVFDGQDQNGYNEDAETNPVNKYGQSKLVGEQNIINNCKDYLIIRTSWLYGKPLSEDAKKSFIEIMIDLAKSGKVKGVTDEIGKPTWTKDLVTNSMELINSKADSGIYHLVNEGIASRLDWTKEIYKIQNITAEIEPVLGTQFPRPAKRPKYELLNNTKSPKLRTWQKALQEYLNS